MRQERGELGATRAGLLGAKPVRLLISPALFELEPALLEPRTRIDAEPLRAMRKRKSQSPYACIPMPLPTLVQTIYACTQTFP
ncbi:MAG: hypothetical protein OXU20_10375 [Myxococcales bacterium]|nr:hypothetical protein [Myxococcales bacterium]MDD9968657.1 hypothetical protein [Myxococcales bacterium]